ncbi:MAG: GAF domain-containing protein [Chloroflexota bacterium]|nr:GAF domain-containing protein [Chloroflexota bacterium]
MYPTSIHDLAARLRHDLQGVRDAVDLNGGGSTQTMRAAYTSFGLAAGRGMLPLEDTMAAATETLQHFFETRGASITDGSIMLAAGIALAATSRAYHGAMAEASSEQAAGATPLPWLEALHNINQAATANLELTTRLETTVRVVAETTGADACSVALYDEATDSLALLAAVGLNPAAIGAVVFRPGIGITGVAAAERTVMAVTDARSHPAYLALPSTGEDLYASQLAVPMLIRDGANGGRLVGVLNIHTIDRRAFAEEEIAFLQTVANELAISIENARLYSRTDARLRRKIAELGTLQRVSHSLASTLDLGDVLRLIAEKAMELFNAESAAIFRFPHRGNRRQQAPTIAFRVGDSRQLVEELSRDEVIRQVLRTGSPRSVEVDDVTGASRLFCLPLRSARETLGALCLRLPHNVELTEDELGLLQAFSDSATLAIENARLYQEARYGLETASALLQEMHHRVRNNLQTVAALLSVQLRQAEEAPWAVHLREAISRVQAIASVHDLLSDERRLAGTTIDVIARHVANEAMRTLIPPGLTVDFQIAKSDITVPSKQATVLALLINELISNAVSHGFENRSKGTVTISSTMEDGSVSIRVENDGERLPAEFDSEQSPGLGMRIIHRLAASDLRGSFVIRSSATATTATLSFPLADDDMDDDLLPRPALAGQLGAEPQQTSFEDLVRMPG